MSAAAASGRVRGRPTGPRTRTADGTVVDSFTIDKDGDDKRVTDTR
ncbi:hypothetical protein PWG71_16370 [Nocardiopsis sp. N85]|nr:hypothetical protein [Nocardiopsis sp. N85]MDE3722966.1 hypothetical protein [Nocardiopsis sp. N85]